jgi:hypothetical protein
MTIKTGHPPPIPGGLMRIRKTTLCSYLMSCHGEKDDFYFFNADQEPDLTGARTFAEAIRAQLAEQPAPVEVRQVNHRVILTLKSSFEDSAMAW